MPMKPRRDAEGLPFPYLGDGRDPIRADTDCEETTDSMGPYALGCDEGCDESESSYMYYYTDSGTYSTGYSSPYPDECPDDSDEVYPDSLRVAHIGPSLVRAGIEQWLKGLARFLDPRRLRMVNCVVTMPDQCDRRLAAELQIPITLGGRDAVRRVARECDVLMFWGPYDLGKWLADCRPRLGLYVAHGEGDFTRRLLEGCRPVTDHVVAVSRLVKERLCEGFPTTIIPNGLDTPPLSRSLPRDESRCGFGFEPTDFVLGYVGRFAPDKCPERVINAAAL